jgi:ketosteroid isomerase-like protein
MSLCSPYSDFMTTKMAEPIDLPGPVAAYFAADMTSAEAVAQCFTDAAVVIDERQEHRGRTAIARWKAEASAKFRYTVERLGAHVSGNQTTVAGRVTGDFPGTPVDLQYRFTLEGDKIARLEIAP